MVVEFTKGNHPFVTTLINGTQVFNVALTQRNPEIEPTHNLVRRYFVRQDQGRMIINT